VAARRIAGTCLVAVLLAALGSALPPGVGPRGLAAAQEVAAGGALVRLATPDGKETTGALHWPAGRPPRAGAVVVHGYGGNFYSGVPATLASGLADRGFAALAVNLRDHDRGPKTTLFEEGRWDVLAAVDALGRRGAAPIVLVGHSLGTNTVLHAAAESRDPRIGAVVLVAAPGNAFEWNVRLFGRERAAAVLEDAQRLQAAGRGRELMLVDLGPLGRALYSADHLVSLRGPATRSDPYRNLGVIAVPVLVVHAGADRLVDPGVAPRLRAAATAAPRADAVEIPGADHGFAQHADALADTVARWLGAVLGR
jgi:alpha-beta hydrolase superfamily lysophospholipase